MELERRGAKQGVSKALKDVLGRCIAEYNKMTTNKKHRIDTDKRKLVQNLTLEADQQNDFFGPICF